MAGKFDLDNYVEVQARINRFWEENPDGRIETDLLSSADHFDHVVFRSRVYKHRDNVHPDSTGIAAEEKGKGGMANSTSWHENGETSAIGRALANMGYATSNKDRPSKEEMAKVQRMEQQAKDLPRPKDPVSDADFLSFVQKCGTNPNNWKLATELAGQLPHRWDLLVTQAPSDAYRKRFEELRPQAVTEGAA